MNDSEMVKQWAEGIAKRLQTNIFGPKVYAEACIDTETDTVNYMIRVGAVASQVSKIKFSLLRKAINKEGVDGAAEIGADALYESLLIALFKDCL